MNTLFDYEIVGFLSMGLWVWNKGTQNTQTRRPISA